jgi:hypothetical protein
VGRLHGPYTLPQPVNEGEVIGGAAKNCLAEMNVSLYEAGDNRAIRGVDHCSGTLAFAANVFDTSSGDK